MKKHAERIEEYKALAQTAPTADAREYAARMAVVLMTEAARAKART